jgi:hypothetical protein
MKFMHAGNEINFMKATVEPQRTRAGKAGEKSTLKFDKIAVKGVKSEQKR